MITTTIVLIQPSYVLGLRRNLDKGTHEFPGDHSYNLNNSYDRQLISNGILTVRIGEPPKPAPVAAPAPVAPAQKPAEKPVADPVVEDEIPEDPVVIEDDEPVKPAKKGK